MYLEKIKRTFTHAGEYSAGIACLLSVIRFYNEELTADRFPSLLSPGIRQETLDDLKQAAIKIGFEANIHIYTLEQLSVTRTPSIVFFENELGEKDFAVCYGMYQQRFVIGEPSFSLMQYTRDEMRSLWIKGIVLILFPTPEFFVIQPEKTGVYSYVQQLFNG